MGQDSRCRSSRTGRGLAIYCDESSPAGASRFRRGKDRVPRSCVVGVEPASLSSTGRSDDSGRRLRQGACTAGTGRLLSAYSRQPGDIYAHWPRRRALPRVCDHRGQMTASEWDWTLRVFDHVDLNASDYTASVRFYETVLSPLGIPKIAEHEQGTWSSAWTDFTNLNVMDRRPPTTHLHLCFYARSKESRLTPSTVWESRPAFGRMVRRGTATTLLVTTRLTCSTRMGTTLRPCTATSETSATV